MKFKAVSIKALSHKLIISIQIITKINNNTPRIYPKMDQMDK